MLKNLQRRSIPPHWLWLTITLGASTFGTSSCGGKKEVVAPPVTPTYGGEQAALFSDLFQPELFGLDQGAAAESDTLLAARAETADFVGPVRVRTVTRETRGTARNYTIVVEATGAPLHGTPRADAVPLTVVEGSPAFAWLEGTGDRWVGTHLLLLLRYYEDGPHFFGALDTPAVRAQLASGFRRTAPK